MMIAMPTTSNQRPKLNDDACYEAMLERRPSASALFIVAVRTTGIYCRPTCAARTPKRQNVEFFSVARHAEAAGYRACKRCRPAERITPEAQLIRIVCRRLEQDGPAPSLDTLSAEFGVSKYHLQRTFTRVVGVSPRRYAEARRMERLKRGLRAENGVAAAVYDAGFGSSSRVYERAPSQLGMTPGSYRKRGEGMRIAFTIVPCSFGRMLVGATERGVSAVKFADADRGLVDALQAEYDGAEIARDDAAMRPWVERVLRIVEQGDVHDQLPLDIRATSFRLRVWEELRRIPRGETRTYGEVAAAIGKPKAARAVGQACHFNPIAGVIPCHRVVAGGGKLGGYAGGLERKKKILRHEGAAV